MLSMSQQELNKGLKWFKDNYGRGVSSTKDMRELEDYIREQRRKRSNNGNK